MIKETNVRARVELEDKQIAMAVLEEIGLTISDLLRMAIKQTAKLKRLPFSGELSIESINAIKEVEQGKARRASHTIDLILPNTPPDLNN